jgi:FlaA1/EpsC-like NDP-sugar epimerase
MQFRNRHFFIADLVLIAFSVLFSFALRLDTSLFLYYLPQALWMTALALLIKPLVYYRFGLYRRLWAYASINELKVITIANTVASLLLAAALALLWVIGVFAGPVYSGFPRSVIAIDWLLSMFAIGGLRFATRLIAENREEKAGDDAGVEAHRACPRTCTSASRTPRAPDAGSRRGGRPAARDRRSGCRRGSG